MTETPLSLSDLEKDDNIKDEPWIIDDTPWLPPSDITINRDIIEEDTDILEKEMDETRSSIPVSFNKSPFEFEKDQQKDQYNRILKPFQSEQFQKDDMLQNIMKSPQQQKKKGIYEPQTHQHPHITESLKNLNIQPNQSPSIMSQSPQHQKMTQQVPQSPNIQMMSQKVPQSPTLQKIPQQVPQQIPQSPTLQKIPQQMHTQFLQQNSPLQVSQMPQQNTQQQILQSQSQPISHIPQSPHQMSKGTQQLNMQSNIMFPQFNPFPFQTQTQSQTQMGFDNTRKSPLDFTSDPFMPLANVNPEEKIWYYKDPKSNVHGPFSGIEMNEWLTKGYFNSDLMVSKGSSEFRQLYAIFLSELRNCFTGMPLVQFLQQLPNNHMFKINLLHIFAMKQSLVQNPYNMPNQNVPNQQHIQPLQNNQPVVPPLLQNQPVQQNPLVVPPLQQMNPQQNQHPIQNVVPPPQQNQTQQKPQQQTEETKHQLQEQSQKVEPSPPQQTKVTPSNVKESSPAPKKNVPSLYEIQQEELRRKEREKKEQELKNKQERSSQEERVRKMPGAWTNVSNKQSKAKSLKEIQQEEIEKKQQNKIIIEETIPMTKPSLNAWGRSPVTKKQPMSLIDIQKEELKTKHNSSTTTSNNNNNNVKDSTSAENFWDYNPESNEPKKSESSNSSTTPGPYLQRAKKGKKQVNPSDIGLIITSSPKKEVIVIDENDEY